MSKCFTLPVVASLIMATIALTTSAGAQQIPFSVVIHDSSAVLRTGQLLDLKATITNEMFGTVNVRAVRFRSELPDSNWYSAMCFGDLCYPPDMDVSPSAKIDVGESVQFKLTVGTILETFGRDTIRVSIRFDTGELTDGIEHTFVVYTDGTAAAPDEPVIVLGSAYPTPASEFATIPLQPADRAARTISVQLVDAIGRVAASVDDAVANAEGVRVDVRGLPDGAYFYRVDVDGVARFGRVVVTH